jgi:hypothetical protein
MAQVGEGVGSDMIFAEQLAGFSGRRGAFAWECGQALLAGRGSFAQVGHDRSAIHLSAAIGQRFNSFATSLRSVTAPPQQNNMRNRITIRAIWPK